MFRVQYHPFRNIPEQTPRTDPCIAGDSLDSLKSIGLSGTGAVADVSGVGVVVMLLLVVGFLFL